MRVLEIVDGQWVFANARMRPETRKSGDRGDLNYRRPQCGSFRSENTRSTFRFSASTTPIRACIKKSRPSAAPIRQAMAICHSAWFCSAFGSFTMKVAASCSVMSWRPRGSGIGSSNGLDQPLVWDRHSSRRAKIRLRGPGL